MLALDESDREDANENDGTSHSAFSATSADNDACDRPDDPIIGEDDAPPNMSAYFNSATEDLQSNISREGNRHGSKIIGCWPWKYLWHEPDDPDTKDVVAFTCALWKRRCLGWNAYCEREHDQALDVSNNCASRSTTIFLFKLRRGSAPGSL